MRKLKFRQPIFDKDNRFLEWHYWGFLTPNRFDGVQTGAGQNIQQAEERSEQFTGLHDKNGKEIYDGDILKSVIGNIGFVRHSDSVCWHITYNLKLNTSLKNPPDENLLTQLWDSHDRWEIIGNIYENPELLKEKP